MPRSRSAAVVAVAILVQLVAGVSIAAAATPPPTIVASPASGPPGLAITLTGSGFTAGTTYGLCILPIDKDKCGFDGTELGGLLTFVAAADGSIPGGTAGIVPNLLAGSFRIVATAPGTGFIVAGTPFTVTAPALAVSPSSGAAGTVATLTLSGGAPGATYATCLDPIDVPQCGGIGVDLGTFTADSAGAFPAGTTVRIAAQPAGSYHVGILLRVGGIPWLIASSPFSETTPSLSLDTAGGPAGTQITASGTGYAAGGSYTFCLVPAGASQCGGVGTLLGTFQADGSGSIPPSTVVTAPAGTPGSYDLGILLTDSTAVVIASSPFALTAGTLAPATATPELPSAAPSAAPAGTDSGGASGVPWLLLVILLLIVLALVFWFSRRRRTDRPTSS